MASKKTSRAEDKNTVNSAHESVVCDIPKRKVLFAASESIPFASSGGLGEVISSLPRAIMESSDEFDVRVIMPYYVDIMSDFKDELEFLGYTYVYLSWRKQYCGIFTTVLNGVRFYFVDNEYYFKRSSLYGFYDDGERYAFFCRAVFETMQITGFTPDIIHAHDWQCALIPVYQRFFYRIYGLKTIFTIHNIEYQGRFGTNIMGDIFGLMGDAADAVEYNGDINLMKGAIESCDILSTVSPSYAQELKMEYYAHGLHDMIRKNDFKLRGILNGIDTVSYDPATDKSIIANYDSTDPSGKKKDKAALQELCALPVDDGIPVVAMISRLVGHKGVDLVADVIDQILDRPIQLVILGKGDVKYEQFFESLKWRYPSKAAPLITYNNDLSRKVYAGADIFLMPSKKEPCGLSQMIAIRYGTVPVVRATGGLKDSISDCSLGQGNGILFNNYDPYDMLNAIDRALKIYFDKDNFALLTKELLKEDFSWARSSKEYIKMYNELY